MDLIFKKFKAAFYGLYYAVSDSSVLLQFLIACGVVLFGFIYGFNLNEWLWILSCIFLVVLCEMFNTCIEKLCDLIDLKNNPKIKVIKDLSAGCVLLASIFSIIIGCMILKGVLR
ncbi:MAG: diacylglycerol kinase family protein [Traorella sp.]